MQGRSELTPTATNSQTKSARYNLAPGLQSRKFRAAEVGLSEMTLVREMKAGRLAYIRARYRVLISEEHMAAWLDSMVQPARVPRRGKKAAAR
jgi:hypothetical protein